MHALCYNYEGCNIIFFIVIRLYIGECGKQR